MSATDLAALYHERWEIEGALAELKTHLRGAQVILRGKILDLVRQEFWGSLLAHFTVRGLMHEAALRADEDPDRLSSLMPCTWCAASCRCFPPIEISSPCIRNCWTRSWRSTRRVTETCRCRAGSSAR